MSVPSTTYVDTYAGSALDLTGYQITFEDNFDSLKLAGSKQSGLWYSGVHSDFGEGTFVRNASSPSPFSIDGGSLHISMAQQNGNWKSGLLQTTDSAGNGFSQSYGYFEVRAKLPGGAGSWPAFWLMSEGLSTPTTPRVEIDTIEAYGLDTLGYHTSIHYTPGIDTPEITAKIHQSDYTRLPATIFDDKFHTFGTMITDQWITTYYDGKEISRIAANEYTRSPFYMILDLAMSRDADKADPNAVYDMQVDYVRAYSNPTLAAAWANLAAPSGSLNGSDTNNALAGTTGADTLVGRKGDDIYYVNHAGDIIVEAKDEGKDTVSSTVTYTLPDNVEQILLTGTKNIDAIGNALANQLTGNDGNNALNGMGGADIMSGGKGDDVYHVDALGDMVIENPLGGTDTVYSAVSFQVGTQSIEKVYLTGSQDINATGRQESEQLYGNSGDNVLDGRSGADLMAGGKGDDTYQVDNIGDVVIEKSMEGWDTVYGSVGFSVGTQSIERVYLTGTLNIDVTGRHETDQLYGNDGANVIDGGGGADLMAGGKGNDTYYVDNGGDNVVENAGEGIDQIFSSVSYALADRGVEKLTLTGKGALNGTGSDGNDTLIGNDGNNKLIGGAGRDTLSGGLGNDTLTGDTGGARERDIFVFNTPLGANNRDQIVDFQPGVDVLSLSSRVFDFKIGDLSPQSLSFGTKVSGAAPHLSYDQGSGNLYYDADGAGSSAPVQVAFFANHAALTAADIGIF